MTDPTPLARAARALDDGAPEAALDLLGDVAGPAAHLLRARALAECGDMDGAVAQAVAAGPDPRVRAEAALVFAAAGRGAEIAGRAPRMAVVDELASGRGTRARGTGGATPAQLARMAEAPGAAAALARLSGAVPQAMLAGLLAARGDRRGAAEALSRAVRAEPLAADIRLAFAEALAAAGHPQAIAEARRATWLAPKSGAARGLRARLAQRAGRPAEAATQAAFAAALSPRDAAARDAAFATALAAGEGAAALARADRLPPARRAPARARALSRLGRDAEAAAALNGARGAEPRVQRAQTLQTLGREDEAEGLLRGVLARGDHPMAWRALAYGGRATPADVAAMRARLARADAPLTRLALARALERTDPAAAFAELARAKAAILAAHPHDAAADIAAFARLRDLWPAARDAGPADTDAAPVFVTGLPRSGTTLVETILAAHPGVRAGGELAVLGPAFQPLETALSHGAPAGPALARAGAAYARLADGLRPGAGRLTDKSIHTYVRLGFVARALPRATLVVVRRDPRDTGLSIWRNHFPDGTHRYANSQTGIADHAALFRDCLAFWRGEVDFHEIAYEDLVADPEGTSRRLLAACDLPWDDAVLRFHETAGAVATLSFREVRKPITAASRGGWARHADHIAPMLGAMRAHGLTD